MRVITLLIFTFMVGCTSIRPITDQTFTQESLSGQLKIGDRTIVLRKDGERNTDFVVNSIEPEYLLGKTDQVDPLIIPYSTIRNIEKYQHSVGKTGALILSLIVGSLAGIALAWQP